MITPEELIQDLIDFYGYEVDSDRTDIVRCHTSSGTALTEILEECCCKCSKCGGKCDGESA